MRAVRRGLLERSLAGIVGAVLGAIVSLILALELSVVGAILWLPPAMCALAGWLGGDRAIYRIARTIGRLG
jgi:hypothetical protein